MNQQIRQIMNGKINITTNVTIKYILFFLPLCRVEYTDCLGRTRKCLRKDLEYLKEKDFELSKTLDSDGRKIDKDASKWVVDTQGTKPVENSIENQSEPDISVTEKSELLSSDMRRELMRQEWEKKEQELLNKTDVHYQDVLFNGKLYLQIIL